MKRFLVETEGGGHAKYGRDSRMGTDKRELAFFSDKPITCKQLSQLGERVEKVIFNPPATIIIFDDGSKSVVKCTQCNGGKSCGLLMDSGLCPISDNSYERERIWKSQGLMLAMLKAAYGSDYLKVLERWVP